MIDVSAVFVADPFIVNENDIWYMFLEVWNKDTDHGDIAFANSDDGLSWTYQQIALDEPFQIPYPYVFKWQDAYYMMPESYQANSIRLYKAVDFPIEWSFVGTLLEGSDYVDSAIFHSDGRWWLFTTTTESDTLYLYYADELMGPWTEHPQSPVIEGDANIARPGGRVLVFDDQIIRYTQDDYPTYGSHVRAFEITELTTTNHEEKAVNQNPILEPSENGWNAKAMHHIDPHQIDNKKWIACVVGFGVKLAFGFQY